MQPAAGVARPPSIVGVAAIDAESRRRATIDGSRRDCAVDGSRRRGAVASDAEIDDRRGGPPRAAAVAAPQGRPRALRARRREPERRGRRHRRHLRVPGRTRPAGGAVVRGRGRMGRRVAASRRHATASRRHATASRIATPPRRVAAANVSSQRDAAATFWARDRGDFVKTRRRPPVEHARAPGPAGVAVARRPRGGGPGALRGFTDAARRPRDRRRVRELRGSAAKRGGPPRRRGRRPRTFGSGVHRRRRLRLLAFV